MQTTVNRTATMPSETAAAPQANDKPVGEGENSPKNSPTEPSNLVGTRPYQFRKVLGGERGGSAVQRSSSLGEKLSRGLWPLDFNKLCAEAMRRTGVGDFDSPALTPALPILLDSLDQEAGLHPLGRFLMRTHLRDLLETRLRLGDVWRAKAGALDAERLEQPVFIVGIPRSGNTFLHELLAEDPEHRAARVWEVMFPLVAGGAAAEERKRIVWEAQARLWWFRRLAPRADAVYPMRAMTPHECVAIHSYTFLSEEFVSTCKVPSYETFLRSVDLTPAYLWEKRFLQYLQAGAPDRRWILKSPDHVHGLEALFSVFPDAFLVQTHRNPVEVLKSSADLTQVLLRLYGRGEDPDGTLAHEARVLAENTEHCMEFRDRHPELADRIVDIKYSQLVADPVTAVRPIYERLGTGLQTPQAERIGRLAAERSRYQGPRASAKPYQIKPEAGAHVNKFEEYCLRFGLPFQGAK